MPDKASRRTFTEDSPEFAEMERQIQFLCDTAPRVHGDLNEAEWVQLAIDVLERRRA